MSRSIDYYFTAQSPWTYLGHDRFTAIAARSAARVRLLPVDYGKVFAVSGGLPLAKRAPQRQAYRLVDLRRFGDALGLPINLHPRFFPVAADDAARLIISVEMADGSEAAMKLSGAVFRAVWVQERDIANAAVLAELLAECGLTLQRLADSRSAIAQDRYEANTRQAIDAGVFGAPSYVIDGEIFWGQDRLEFVERRLNA